MFLFEVGDRAGRSKGRRREHLKDAMRRGLNSRIKIPHFLLKKLDVTKMGHFRNWNSP
jgi:hypothetical protein